MCTVLLSPGDNSIAVNKYITSLVKVVAVEAADTLLSVFALVIVVICVVLRQ